MIEDATQELEPNEWSPCPECQKLNPPGARFCAQCGVPFSEKPTPHESHADPLVGRVIAERYRLLSVLGRGGMGVVYKAEHVHIGKIVAMKILHGDLARDRTSVKRFRREAEAVSRLSHPNTVQIFDFGSSEGMIYLVMEYLAGEDLGAVLKRDGALPAERVFKLALQVCASLEEAHRLGIVHRDLKPENVLVLPASEERPERAKVLDFGLAKLRDEGAGNTVTRAGTIVGTPYYMSPEQIQGEAVDPKNDIYSLGAMMYKALTGEPPFVASTPMAVLTKHLTGELTPPSKRNETPVDAGVDPIIRKAMARSPKERYPSVTKLAGDLRAYLSRDGSELTDPSVRLSDLNVSGGHERATRRDVDNYEQRIRRRGIFAYLALFALLGGLGYAGYEAYKRYEPPPALVSHEREPNDEPSQALPLPEGASVDGMLGRRLQEDRGDEDLYLIRNAGRAPRRVTIDVGPIPNIDVVVDIVRIDQHSPILTADSGPAGAPERIPDFPLGAYDYLVRVRERAFVSQAPTENVSDAYTIRWETVTVGPGWETEVNDSLELADDLSVPGEMRGYIAWADDNDTFCFDATGGEVQVELSSIPGVDVVLRAVDRVRHRSRKIDENGVGEGERTTITAENPEAACVEVSVDERDSEPLRGNGRDPYQLTLTRVEAESGEEAAE